MKVIHPHLLAFQTTHPLGDSLCNRTSIHQGLPMALPNEKLLLEDMAFGATKKAKDKKNKPKPILDTPVASGCGPLSIVQAPINWIKRLWPFQSGTVPKAPAPKAQKIKKPEKTNKAQRLATAYQKKVAQENPSIFKQAMDGVVNMFHLGVGLFVLAGVPLLHGHLAVAIGAAIGLQLLQHYVKKIYGPTSIHDPKLMDEVIHNIQQKYNRVMVDKGSEVLKKIPLLNRLEPLYSRIALGAGNILKRGCQVISRLCNSTVAMSEVPDSFGGKLRFVLKTVLFMTIDILTGPFGKVGRYIAQGLNTALNLKDMTDFVNVLRGKDTPTDESPSKKSTRSLARSGRRPQPAKSKRRTR